MGQGDHIYVNGGAYTHHGIDCGDGTVIHHPGGLNQKLHAVISHTSMASFSSDKQIFMKKYDMRDSRELVIRRAESQLNKVGYDLFNNNCEHFATWCMTGVKDSKQVNNARAVVGIVVLGVLAVMV